MSFPPTREFAPLGGVQPRAGLNFTALRAAAAAVAEAIEDRPAIVIAALTILYILMLLPIAARPLWHDELFTYYIAQAPTLTKFIEDVRRLDLNPPLVYGATRIAQQVFGMSPAATRVPSMLAFYGACLLLFVYLRRRMGALYAGLAIMIFWSSPLFFRFAAEARPYALLIFFFTLLLLSYDTATREDDITGHTPRGLALFGVVSGMLGMSASHVFAVFTIAAFFFAEALRFLVRRKPDFALWAAMIFPLAPIAIYIPLVKSFNSIAFPPAYQGSFHKIAGFFSISLKQMFGNLAAVFAASLAVGWLPRTGRLVNPWRVIDLGIGGGLLAMPFVINIILMRSHGAFWDRYCLTSAIAVYCSIAAFLAWRFRRESLPALSACAALFVILLGIGFLQPYLEARRMPPTAAELESIDPALPLVCASGVTFLEMDHNESAAAKQRLYLLQDRALALEFAHATLFEGFGVLRTYFPIEGHVMAFHDFVAQHREFLVLGRIDHPEDWLLPKLVHDKAQVTYLGQFRIPYVDQTLYRVTLAQP